MMQSKADSNICYSCLSLDRKLRPLGSFPGYLAYCFGLGLNADHEICWECSAALNKYHEFRKRALIAQKLYVKLKSFVFSEVYPERLFYASNNITKLSTLTSVTRSSYNTVYVSVSFRPLQLEQEQVFLYSANEPNEPDDEANVTVKEEEIPIDDVKEEKLPFDELDVETDGRLVSQVFPAEEPQVSPSTITEPLSRQNTTSTPNIDACHKSIRHKRRRLAKSKRFSKTKTKKKSRESVAEDTRDPLPSPASSATDSAPETAALATSSSAARQAVERVTDDILTRTLDRSQLRQYLERRRAELAGRGGRGLRCEPCAQGFRSHRRLEAHMVLHSPSSGSFQCDVCTQRFHDKSTLKEHEANHYRYFECRQCGRREPDARAAAAHWREQHRGLPCARCPLVYRCRNALKRHQRTAHGQAPTPKVCGVCGKTYVGYSHPMTHKFNHCTVCNKKIKGGSAALRQHEMTHSSMVEDGAYCVPCDKQFKTRAILANHLKTHAHCGGEGRRFECDHCGGRYSTKVELQSHIERIHLRLLAYKCSQCDLRFKTSSSRARHHRTTHDAAWERRKYVCQLCGKVFLVKKSLKEHLDGHGGRRPLRCDLCPASFTYSAALYTHRRLLHLKIKRTRRKKEPPPQQTLDT